MDDSIIRYANQDITEISEELIPEETAIIPLRNAVILPGVLLPIFVGRTESVKLIEDIGKPGELVGMFTQIVASDDNLDESNLYHTGCLAEIHRVIPMGEGGFQVTVQGVQKIQLKSITSKEPYLKGKIQPVGEIKDSSEEQFAELQAHVTHFIENHPAIPDDMIGFTKRIKNPSALANQIIFFSQKEISEKIEFLKITSIAKKLGSVQENLIQEINRLKMEKEVRDKVELDTGKIQREFYLRKQLEVIRKELDEDEESESDELEQQLREKWLPEYLRKAVNKDLKRLRKAEEGPHGGGMESSQIRNWLELIVELPWEDPEEKEINLSKAEKILNEDHEGLEEVKKRILEFLAIEKQTGGSRAPILCLVGPPGVGKTSLARSIARAMDRPFVRAALGGVRDEAEIRGHRRTYIGALPGKIIASMKKGEARDPVFLLDEIDKTGSSSHGDPSAALLEVLDPEQNQHFEDHYLGHPYDLSRVLFVATANSMDSIPLPLQDRMEIVHLSGYTLAEKKAIAKNHLLPEILNQLKFKPDQIQITDSALEKVIVAHTREAGVRSLKRKLESIARKTVRRIIQDSENTEKETSDEVKLLYSESDISDLLGRDRYYHDFKENTGMPGVAIGLAWTPVGGDILYIEAASFSGKGEMKLSGQLGDVMKESAYAAMTFLRSHASEMNIDLTKFQKEDVHIHIPSGAIPKDGPSAGVTLLTALTSLFSDSPVAPDIAMTGEISLRGRVLPVGGIKEKVLAARAAGIATVLLPEKNRPDYEEIPSHVTDGLKAEYYSDMLTILKRTVPGAFKNHSADVHSQREGW